MISREKVFKRKSKDELLTIMRNEKPIVLPSGSIEQQIEFIIKLVKEFERKYNGLTDEEISYKYTHGDCGCLATLIKRFIPKASVKGLGDGEYAHTVIRIKDPNYISEERPVFHEDIILYDINGRKTYDEMVDYIVSELMDDRQRQLYNSSYLSMSWEEGGCIDNDTTEYLTAKINESIQVM